MAIPELISLLKELSHFDKLLILYFLVNELLKESGLVPLGIEGQIASQGLHDSFEATPILAQALAEEKTAKHS